MCGSVRLGPRRDSVEAPEVDKVCCLPLRYKAVVGVILLKIAIFDQFSSRPLLAPESVLGQSLTL